MTTEGTTQQPEPAPPGNGRDAAADAGVQVRTDVDETARHKAEQGTKSEPRPGQDVDRDELYRKIMQELDSDSLHDEEIQYELARWVELVETSRHDLQLTRKERRLCADDAKQDLAKRALVRRLMRKASAAIPALICGKPELVFARTLRIRAEMHLLRRNGWSTRHLISLTDGSPTMIVGLGTLLAFLSGVIGSFIWPYGGASLIPLDATFAPLVAAAAYLGGLVSILTRLQSFSKLRDFDPMFLFLNALAKPFVGAVFGLFAYAAVKSGLVPLDKTVLNFESLYSLWAIGFLAGFSERFANDLVSRGEGLAAPKKS